MNHTAPPSILQRIVARRRERIARQGYALGCEVPRRREQEALPFPQAPALICEIKRRSPSRGAIASGDDPGSDPVEQAIAYHAGGARTLSVLTEEEHFGGSLDHLMAIRRALPDMAIMRKDFLLDPEEIEVSWRAGADAVLLIAAILSPERLQAMLRRCEALGIAALVEVHTAEEIAVVADCQPSLVGINSRNLNDFSVDLLRPLRLRSLIDWPCLTVCESGIWSAEELLVARAGGFEAALVGEALMRNPSLVPELIEALQQPVEPSDGGDAGDTPARIDFWTRVTEAATRRGRRPLVKICGITNRADAVAAIAAGADLLGLVFAPSPRRAPDNLPADLSGLPVLKVAVVVADDGLDPVVSGHLRAGLLNAVQFHGSEPPERCAAMAFPYYKALRLRHPADAVHIREYHSPRVLVDAFDPDRQGGTGRRIDDALIEAARRERPLWLAGGLAPENIGELVRRFRPELVDVSSRLEGSSGRKDHHKMRRFFDEIDHVCR